MITFVLKDTTLTGHQSACYAATVVEGAVLPPAVRVLTQWVPDLAELLEKSSFTGKKGQSFFMPFMHDGIMSSIILLGLGDAKKDKKMDIELFRRAIGSLCKKLVAHKQTSVSFVVPEASIFGVTNDYLVKQTAIMFTMGSYHFTDYITDAAIKEGQLADVALFVDAKYSDSAQKALEEGICIGNATNQTRHWIDIPPSDTTPEHLAQKAETIAKKHGLNITVFSEAQINQMGMGGLAGVSRGSDLDCRLVVMEYAAKNKNAPTIVFVGKGITFDSGGLSIKPAASMENMKDDMSGAAAVISAMEVLAQLKPSINVIGIAPMAENLPSGKALKPGDIVRFYNGKTAEVRNTDAEGRLILADALSYAVKHYKPDAIVDIATLTGACAYALGPYYTGLMSEHDDLVDRLQEASKIAGEPLWRLPMSEDYKAAIKSSVADICNIGSKDIMAGAITAAHFLQNFVGDTPWAHLDIAGTAFDVPHISYYRHGATGVSVRLMVELAMNWKE